MEKTTAKKSGNILRRIFFLFIPIPFILGMIALLLEGQSFWNAAYTCLGMYLFNYSEPVIDPLIQLARWLAPVATASTLTLIFSAIGTWVKRIYAALSKKSVGVFGDDPLKSELLAQLGINGVPMDKAAVRAGSYILVGSEEDNLAFYQRSADKLANKDVYLKCQFLREQASNDPKLHLFSPEETAARIFWKNYCPYDLSRAMGHCMSIAVIGFDRLGEELLVQGLQYNIFDPNQKIAYHIFGQDTGFTATHPQLSQITDPVIFHSEPWYKATALLADCEMLIVVQQENQLKLLQDLTALFPKMPVYVFSAQPSGVALFEKNTGVKNFDWQAVSTNLENIRSSRMHYLAKKLNLRYAHLYNNIAETEENLDSEWEKLDTFTRYSNISSANYHDVCIHILNGEELTEERLVFLGELEHIRWCRYHYLNNWQYGIPANGKSKDSVRRIHKLLVPNSMLMDQEHKKDQENIRMLMDMQAK